jgi:hypothetical protein
MSVDVKNLCRVAGAAAAVTVALQAATGSGLPGVQRHRNPDCLRSGSSVRLARYANPASQATL